MTLMGWVGVGLVGKRDLLLRHAGLYIYLVQHHEQREAFQCVVSHQFMQLLLRQFGTLVLPRGQYACCYGCYSMGAILL